MMAARTAAVAVLALAGCAAPSLAPVDAHNGITCITVDTLTTRATTVYMQTDRPGSVLIQADCTVAVTVTGEAAP